MRANFFLVAFFAGCLPAQTGVTLSWLGTAGWEITDGKTVVLIDPYLSRVKSVTPNDGVLETDTRRFFTRSDGLVIDEAVIDAHIRRADFVLITHTHTDHALDMPYIARKTGATVIGTESTINYARAAGVPEAQCIVAKGGEDFQFDAISLRVIPSLHGVLRRTPNAAARAGIPRPQVVPPNARPPFTKDDLVEGGTLAYLIRIGGEQILAFGSMNYIEREIEGLRPDVALLGAMPDRREIFQYTPRLMKALGYPRIVLPAHWDRFNVPYDVSQEPAKQRLLPFLAEVKAASPKTRVIVPEYFSPIRVDKAARGSVK